MAKNNTFTLTFQLQDDGSLKQLGNEATKTGKKLKKGVTNEAHSADRAMKGLSNQSSNATKNFSKMSQGLAGGIVPIYATLAAQIFAVSAAFQFLKGAADYRMLMEGQKAFGVATGVMYKGLTKIVMDATDSQITYQAAAEAVAIGTASGLNPTQLEKLATAAKRVSIALGRDMTDSFNRLVRGATKAEPELLDELGIVLRLEPALKKYGDRIGKSGKELTAFQRTQAVTNEILEQAERKYAAIEAIMEPQTNKLNEAAVAFDELLNSFKLWLAGPVEALASFFAKNILTAVSLVTLFAFSIIRNMLPSIKEWQGGIADASVVHTDRVNQMRADLAAYRLELAATQAQARGGFAAGMSTQQGRARGLDPATYGAGTGMAVLAAGGIASKRQLGSLKGQLSRKVGPFSDKALGKNAENIRKQWQVTFDSMDENAKGAGRTMKNTMKEVRVESKIASAKVTSGWLKVKGMFMGIAGWALKALRVVSYLGMITIIAGPIYEMFKNWLVGADNADVAADSLQNFIEQQRVLNAEAREFLQYSKEVEQTGYWAHLAQKSNMMSGLRPLESYAKTQEARVTRTKASAPATTAMKNLPGASPFSMSRMLNNLIGRTVGGLVSSDIEAVVAADEEVEETAKSFMDTLGTLQEIAPTLEWEKFNEEFKQTGKLSDKTYKDFENLVTVVREGKDAIAQEQEAIDKLGQARNAWMRPKSDARGNLINELTAMEKNLQNQLNLAEKVRTEYSKQSEEGQKILALEERKTAVTEERLALEKIISDLELARSNKASATLGMEGVKGTWAAGTSLGQRQTKEFELAKGKAELLEKETLLRDKQLVNISKLNAAERISHDLEMSQLRDSIALIKQKNSNLANSVDGLHMIGSAAVTALDGSMQSAIVGVLDGTKSMKEGFLDMAKAVLQAIAQIIAKLIAMKAIQAMGFGFADGGIIPMANGGVMNRKIPGYSNGGVVTHPTYLVGEGKYNEAVVPLPDGRSIPVQMAGNSGGTANVVVNVSSDGETTSNMTANGGEQAAQLGRAISTAVQEELHKQQRNGGILSPYGNPGGGG